VYLKDQHKSNGAKVACRMLMILTPFLSLSLDEETIKSQKTKTSLPQQDVSQTGRWKINFIGEILTDENIFFSLSFVGTFFYKKLKNNVERKLRPTYDISSGYGKK
jgi:hypothetical protein